MARTDAQTMTQPSPAEIAALRERLNAKVDWHHYAAEHYASLPANSTVHRVDAADLNSALALLDAQAAEIARLTAELERGLGWIRKALRVTRAVAIEDAARVCEAMAQPKDGDLAWLLAERIRALAPAPAAEVE